jgi:hypothetical protein
MLLPLHIGFLSCVTCHPTECLQRSPKNLQNEPKVETPNTLFLLEAFKELVPTSSFLSEGVYLSDFHEKAGWLIDAIKNNKQKH